MRLSLAIAKPQAAFLCARRDVWCAARVRAALRADAERSDAGRDADASPPLWPPFFAGDLLVDLPRPEPLFLPPCDVLLTVAQARRFASFSEVPRFS